MQYESEFIHAENPEIIPLKDMPSAEQQKAELREEATNPANPDQPIDERLLRLLELRNNLGRIINSTPPEDTDELLRREEQYAAVSARLIRLQMIDK